MPLSRDEVLEGALRLLDDVGLDALTMRQLAKQLDVQAGAIYWHFANKQDLIDAMVDRQLGGILATPVVGRWDRQLAELCRRLVTALTATRDGARLATSALAPGKNGLLVSEAMLRAGRESRLSPEESLWATAALGYYVLGYVTDVQATEAAKARGLTVALTALRRQVDPQTFPELTKLSTGRRIQQFMSGKSFRERFEFGLELLLDGMRAQRRRSLRQSRRR
jgi:TetR/AcrR family tetracycline transcriptional repressor